MKEWMFREGKGREKNADRQTNKRREGGRERERISEERESENIRGKRERNMRNERDGKN